MNVKRRNNFIWRHTYFILVMIGDNDENIQKQTSRVIKKRKSIMCTFACDLDEIFLYGKGVNGEN